MVVATPISTIPLHTDATGIVRVSGTRVALDTIIAEYNLGASAEEIAHNFDAVPLADVYSVIGYYLSHRAEVDAYLAEGEVYREKMQHDCQFKYSTAGFRERLLARRSANGT